MADWLNDTFTDSDGATLNAASGNHVASPTGGTWLLYSGHADPIICDSNRMRINASSIGYAGAYNTATPTTKDQYVEMVVRVKTSVAQHLGVKLRTNHFVYYGNTSWIFIFAGQPPQTIVSDPGRFATTGIDYTIRIEETGTGTIKITVDGTLIATYSVPGGLVDSSVGDGNGLTFFDMGGVGTGTGAGFHVDSIKAGPATPVATTFSVDGHATLTAAVATQADASTRGYVGGPIAVNLRDSLGAVAALTGSFSASLSDGAGGTFSPSTVTINAGSSTAYSVYAPSGTGSRTITATETTSNGFGAKTLAITSVADHVSCYGDSRTDYIGGSPGGTSQWPLKVYSWVAGSIPLMCFAGAGSSVADITGSQKPTYFDPIKAAITGKKIVVIWSAGNSLTQGQTATQTYNAIVAACQAFRADGAKVIVCTDPHRATVVGINPDLDTINANIRANWSSYADRLVDLAGDNRLDFANATASSGNNADGTHLTAAGEIVVGSLMEPAILDLYYAQTTAGSTPRASRRLTRSRC